MKISYQWLKRYIDTDLELDEILTVLTDIGLEVDGVERFESVRGGLEGVVVGEVLTCTDHPDSDHLHLTEVAVGREEPLKIVCGSSERCRRAEGARRHRRGCSLSDGCPGGFQDKKEPHPRCRLFRHDMRRRRTRYRHGTRRHHGPPAGGCAGDTGGRFSRTGVGYRYRNRTDAQPGRCHVALRRGPRPGGFPESARQAGGAPPCPVRRVSTTGDCLRRRLPWSVRRGPRAMPAW